MPNEPEPSPSTDTFKTRVAAFWDWFSTNGSRFKKIIDDGDCHDLVEETARNVEALIPGLAWMYGPGKAPGRHALTLSPEGRKPYLLLSEYWRQQMPEIPDWDFYGCKQPNPEALNAAVGVGDLEFRFKEVWLVPTVNRETEKIDIDTWHPLFEKLDDRSRHQILFILLDELLGEQGTGNWIGSIELSNERFENAIPIKELPELIAKTKEETGWKKPAPLKSWSAFRFDEPLGDFPRGDMVTGVTLDFDLLDAWIEAKGKPDDPIAGTGADFIFTSVTSALLPEGKEVEARGEIEDAIAEQLVAAEAGVSIGGATGREHFYSDYLIVDGAKSLEIIAGAMKTLQLPPGTGIHYFAREKQSGDIIL